MQRTEMDVLTQQPLDLGVHLDRTVEVGARVKHAVTDRLDLGDVLDRAAEVGRSQTAQHELERRIVIGKVFCDLILFAADRLRQVGTGDADALDAALGDDALVVRLDELIFDGRTARIDDQYFHFCLFVILATPGPRS